MYLFQSIVKYILHVFSLPLQVPRPPRPAGWPRRAPLTMNRQRAYRKLLSRSAAFQPSVVEVYENLAFYKMAEKPRHMPVVKLKVGEPLANPRRGRSVAELNNLRANYNHFCHYRKSSATRREFPPLRASPAPPSPVPSSPTRDTTVIFMLRGTQRRSRARKGSAASQTQLPANSLAQEHAQKPGAPSFSGHLIVKRKDTTTPTTGVMSAVPRVAGELPTAPTSASDGINGYELRGSSVFKSSTSEQRDDDDATAAYAGRLAATQGAPYRDLVLRQTPERPRGAAQRFMPRPGSYVTARRTRDLFSYENERPGVVYDHRAVYYDPRPAASRGAREGRKVQFDGTPASVSTYVFPLDERGLRLTHSQHPQQLTQKNLEIFDYLHSPKPTFGAIETPPKDEGGGGVSRRVLDWVEERQLDMTSLLREVTSEGANTANGVLPPTPEVNELDGRVNDLDDPDLEVYDLTKEEDFLSHDEVIDAVVDDMSCEG